MPGDLNDPEQWLPFYHDRHYDPGPNQFEPKIERLDNFLQSISVEVMGLKLDKAGMAKLKRHLDSKGFLYRNWGDPSFHDEAAKFMKTLALARKVARRCQI